MMTAAVTPPMSTLSHLGELRDALTALERDALRLEHWGAHIAAVTCRGGRVLAAGNGGSAAQAQHFTAELVGRYLGERRALSAIALTGDTASVTAVGNDYGYDEVFVRQIAAHAREGDVLLLLSTSGRSANVVAAAHAAHERGVTVYALTGPMPNPLSECAHDTFAIATTATPVIQEVHQVAIHLVCDAVDRWVCAAEANEWAFDG
jgi:D-sedoheptulose 7-phosphate isomerase